MYNNIEKEYEQLEIYIKENTLGGIVKKTENIINEWEKRIAFTNDENKQPDFKIGDVYAAQIKNMGRLMYDVGTCSYKTVPVVFKDSKEKLVASLYTFFTFDGEILPRNLDNNFNYNECSKVDKNLRSSKVLLFTEAFSGKKFICTNHLGLEKQKIWELINNGVILSISDMKIVNDDLLLDIGRETLNRKEDVSNLIFQKQNAATELIENDMLNDKNDAFIMASAENVMRKVRHEVSR